MTIAWSNAMKAAAKRIERSRAFITSTAQEPEKR